MVDTKEARLAELERDLSASKERLTALFKDVESLPSLDESVALPLGSHLAKQFFSDDQPTIVDLLKPVEEAILSLDPSPILDSENDPTKSVPPLKSVTFDNTAVTKSDSYDTSSNVSSDPQMTTIDPSQISQQELKDTTSSPQKEETSFIGKDIHQDYIDNGDDDGCELPSWAQWNLPDEVVSSRLAVGGLLGKIRQSRDTNRDREKGGAVGGASELFKLAQAKPHSGQSVRSLLSASKKHQHVSGARPRSGKVLSSRDWMVAHAELRAQRAMELIEKAKHEGKWTFRQPKKHKAPSVAKAHWDYLLEEMKWMQTDFKQERRSKAVSASELANTIRYWKSCSIEERRKMQIPVRRMDDDVAGLILVRHIDQDDVVPLEELKNQERRSVHEQDSSMVIQDGETEELQEKEDGGEDGGASKAYERKDDSFEVKAEEDNENVDAEGDEDYLDAEAEPDEDATGSVSYPHPSTSQADLSSEVKLRDLSSPPVERKSPEQQNGQSNPSQSFQTLVAAREPIFSLESTTTNVDASKLGLNDADKIDSDFFNTYLPDLPLYELPQYPSDSTKADKRFDESTPHHSRISSYSKLLDSKPLLLSTLQPGRKRKRNGEWNDLSEIINEKPQENQSPPPEISPGCFLFTGKKPKEVTLAPIVHAPHPPPDAEARAASFDWTPEEDNMLLAFTKQYAYNWHLIADIFNASTRRVATDTRIAWDLYYRWDKKFGPGSQATPTSAAGSEGGSGPKKEKKNNPSKYDGPKKKLRHICLYDAMRKLQKKRETYLLPRQGAPSRRVNLNAHETHTQPTRPVYTPLDLSRYKGERDRQIELQRRSQDMQARMQQQAMAQASANAQSQQQQQQQQSTGESGQAITPCTQRSGSQPNGNGGAVMNNGNQQGSSDAQSNPHVQSPHSIPGTPSNGTTNQSPQQLQQQQQAAAAMSAGLGNVMPNRPGSGLSPQHAAALQMQMQNLSPQQQQMLLGRQYGLDSQQVMNYLQAQANQQQQSQQQSQAQLQLSQGNASPST